MKRISLLISRYLLGAILPYFLFSWALLTVILFLQQASRYADLFFNVNLQGDLVWQLMIGLVPNVIAFTCPMAVLVGTVIGLSKLQGDSELVAIRAAGVGNSQIAVPIIVLGLVLSAFAFLVNIKGVPLAAAIVRRVAMQSAIAKFESPIEPGIFYTEVDGFTILARGADPQTGKLQNVFISQRDNPNGVYRLITSDVGRMDLDGESTELVLENASVVTVPIVPDQRKYAFESIHDVRVALKTKRAEMLERLSSVVKLPDELGLAELKDLAASAEGKDKIEAQIIFQRRIIMSLTPLVFCLLGTVMVLRFRRGGRGFGIFLALFGLIGYYLAAFLGEQLARTGSVSVFIASIFPLLASIGGMTWLGYSSRFNLSGRSIAWLRSLFENVKGKSVGLSRTNRLLDVTSGLRDFDVASSLVKYFLLSAGFLLTAFLIFTAFETWRYASGIDGGSALLIKYLAFLTPFAYLQIAPSAAMIATLATYSIKSRNNELVTWASAGQSVFRLLLPCLALTVVLGVVDFAIQDFAAPRANRIQDELRTKLRGGGFGPSSGRKWAVDGNYVYSYEAGQQVGDSSLRNPGNVREGGVVYAADREPRPVSGGAHSWNGVILGRSGTQPVARSGESTLALVLPGFSVPFLSTYIASDNERGRTCDSCVRDLIVLEFSGDRAKLQSVYRSDLGEYRDGKAVLTGNVECVFASSGEIRADKVGDQNFVVSADPFRSLSNKPSHLSVGEMRQASISSTSASEQRTYDVGVQRRLSALFLPLVIMLFSAPWAISLRPVAMVPALSAAVGLWLLFIGITNVFEQFGTNGSLAIGIAVWAPLAAFALLGLYLIGRVRS